jgi:3-dehydroquinate dehydratase-2
MKLLVLNGPNLNLLGKREPDTYGHVSLAAIEKELRDAFPDVSFEFFQSNHEGDLIDRIHQSADAGFEGVIINPAGYSHTSVAIRDAISATDTPVVEVHISNIAARERFRHHSVTAAAAVGTISGLGVAGYRLAVTWFLSRK